MPAPLPPADATGRHDVTMPMSVLVRWVLRWTLVLGLLTLGAHTALWGLPAFGAWAAGPSMVWTALAYGAAALGIYVLSAALHEGLHVLAMVWGAGVPWRAVRVGVRWREGVAYAHAAVPMTVRAYRMVLAVPGLVQGVAPLVAGLALGHGWLTLYGYVMLASSLGDVAILLLLRPFPGTALAEDHPEAIGCRVYPTG